MNQASWVFLNYFSCSFSSFINSNVRGTLLFVWGLFSCSHPISAHVFYEINEGAGVCMQLCVCVESII